MQKGQVVQLKIIIHKLQGFSIIPDHFPGLDFTKPEGLKIAQESGMVEKICFNVIRDTIRIVEEIW